VDEDKSNPARPGRGGGVNAAVPMRPVDGAQIEFLRHLPDVVLFCRDVTGSPIGYPMRTVAVTDAAIVFTTYRKSPKVAHLERDPRACVLATEWPRCPADPGVAAGWAVRWLSVSGRARVVTPTGDQIREVFGDGGRPDGETRVPAGMADHVQDRLRDGKRVLVYVECLRSVGMQGGQFRELV